jgi:hypothetical protein
VVDEWSEWETVFGYEVAVRDFGIDGSIFRDEGAIGIASAFEGLLGFAFDALGIVLLAEFFCGVVAVFLERVDLAGETTEDADGACVLSGIGSELLLDIGLKEEAREMSGGELEADFGKLAGVSGAEVLDEVVLEKAAFESAVLFGAPIAIAAASFPVGDIALGDFDAVFVESANDSGLRDVIAEHAIDHVALWVREAGDFASSAFGFGSAGSCWLIVVS